MMLATQPASMASMDTVIFPTAWKIFSKARDSPMGTQKRKTMLE